MFLRYTMVALSLAVASTADAQLQQPESLRVRNAKQSAVQPSQTAPQPLSLAVLRESDADNATPRMKPIVFDDADAPESIAAPGYTEYVPRPAVDNDKEQGYCSHCHGDCGCRNGLCGRIRQHHLYYFGYDPEGWVRPFGAATAEHLQAQVANGVAARMTLYAYDFTTADEDQVKLNPAGWQQLARIAELANRSDFPIVIEPAPYQKGTEQLRRQAVLDGLRAMGSTVAADRVVVAQPAARGLSGQEALIINDNLLQQTQVRGEIVDDQFTTDGFSGSSN